VAHFPRMVGIVAADAKDPPDREDATPANRDPRDRGRRNDKLTHVDVSEQVGKAGHRWPLLRHMVAETPRASRI
jgi:hypothetical protein